MKEKYCKHSLRKKKYTAVCELSRVGLFVTCLFFLLGFNSTQVALARVRAWQFKVCTQRVIRRESKTDSYSKGPTLFGLRSTQAMRCILCHNF